jgi:MOSC domain-containing protein YiiM
VAATGRGAYLRILHHGTVAAGDTIHVAHRPGHRLSAEQALDGDHVDHVGLAPSARTP